MSSVKKWKNTCPLCRRITPMLCVLERTIAKLKLKSHVTCQKTSDKSAAKSRVICAIYTYNWLQLVIPALATSLSESFFPERQAHEYHARPQRTSLDTLTLFRAKAVARWRGKQTGRYTLFGIPGNTEKKITTARPSTEPSLQNDRRKRKHAQHKRPAGSGMERVGVSNSLLGTYDQHVGFTSDFVSGDDEKYLILVACSFFLCFTSAASKFCQNAVTSTDASLGADVSISTAACVFYSLTCLAYNLATWVPHSWNKLSCAACVNLHCQLRMRKGICFDWGLRDFGI